MATKSTNIRIDEKTKVEAIALFARFGLGLSDAVNMFLRVSIEEQGVPFPLTLRPRNTRTIEAQRASFDKFLKIAEENPAFEKGYKFNRDECHDR